MKHRLKKLTPNRDRLEKYKILKPVAKWLGNPKIWHFNRRAIAMGVAIGFFFGSLPIAGQMLLSAVVSIVSKANMPISVVATWISNPVTMPFLFTANYYFGAWLLQRPSLQLGAVDWSLQGLLQLGREILVPLFLGSIVVGVILAVTSYIVIRIMWRLHIVSYLHSRQVRRK